jgi:long-chain acyl-CoA synthetase
MSQEETVNPVWYKHWPPHVPKHLSYPECSLANFLEETATRHGKSKAIIFLQTEVTYEELWEWVKRLATALDRLGLKKGDVCALMLPNSYQFVVSYYACQLLGITVTAINPTYKALEIQHQLRDSGSKALIVLDAVFNEVSKGLEGTRVKEIIGTNIVDLCRFSTLKTCVGKLLRKIPTGNLPREALKFSDLMKADPNPPVAEIDPYNDIAVLQYTGGTTGRPKGAMLTHSNVAANATQCESWLWKRKPGMGIIGVLPLFHVYAMTTVMNMAIKSGSFQLLLPRPPADMAELFSLIRKYGPEGGFIMPGVAALFNKINTHPEVTDYDLSSLIMALSGAGPLPLEIQNRFEELTGSIIVEGYGLSEATPVTHANPVDKELRKLGTIGLPFPDTEIKIMDRETGTKELPLLPFPAAKTGGLTEQQCLEADAYTGELAVKGPQVMKGYLNRPEETDAALRDGWLFTGDIACIDADGYTIIRDRAKDMIKCKGYNVYPAEVEDLLNRHPDIRTVAVIGVPHAALGEQVKAFVVPTPEKMGKLSEKEIQEWAKDKMTSYKVPSIIEFREDLPTTIVGKVLRRVLKNEEQGID